MSPGKANTSSSTSPMPEQFRGRISFAFDLKCFHPFHNTRFFPSDKGEDGAKKENDGKAGKAKGSKNMALPFSISQFPRKIPGFLPRRKVRIKNRKYGKISFLELIPGLFQKIEHQNKLQHWLPQNLIYGFGN